eukprot:EG_transcript_3704
MPAPMKLGRHGLRGLYRFVDPDVEAQYQARLVQWCFWPAVVHLWAVMVTDGLKDIGYFGLSPYPAPPGLWSLVVVDAAAVALALAFHCSPRCRRRVVPLFCAFVCAEMAEGAALVGLQAQWWTADSFSSIVPAASSIYVDGPGGDADVSGLLRGHLARLAAYQATGAAFNSALSCWIFNMLLGLNWWSICTTLWIPVAFSIGACVSLPSTPHIDVVIAFCTSALALVFAAALERMQRRHFEAERRLHWELQASQMADSVLNHSLKNTLADVAGNIEMFLAQALPDKVLEDCIVSLRRGIRSCKERQGYLQLVAGQYQPVLNAVNLQDFGRQLLAGRHATGRFPDCTIYADHMLLTLIFDNALSNAAKHGDPQNADVTFSIEEIPADVCQNLPLGKRRFCFQVTNMAHPGRPELTPEYVAQLFAGQAEPPPERGRNVQPELSDRIGLAHCVMAAKLGGIALSLSQEFGLVSFSGTLDAEVQEATVAARRLTSDSQDTVRAPARTFPAGLQFVVLDDSPSAQRLLRFHIEKWCKPASVLCLGTTAADVDAFVAHALLADVVIVDQHLDWDQESCLGSDLARRLRMLRFEGFICVRSAQDGPSDQALYRAAGANCAVGKDLLGPVMVEELLAAYEEFVRQASTTAMLGTPRIAVNGGCLSPAAKYEPCFTRLDVPSSSSALFAAVDPPPPPPKPLSPLRVELQPPSRPRTTPSLRSPPSAPPRRYPISTS